MDIKINGEYAYILAGIWHKPQTNWASWYSNCWNYMNVFFSARPNLTELYFCFAYLLYYQELLESEKDIFIPSYLFFYFSRKIYGFFLLFPVSFRISYMRPTFSLTSKTGILKILEQLFYDKWLFIFTWTVLPKKIHKDYCFR